MNINQVQAANQSVEDFQLITKFTLRVSAEKLNVKESPNSSSKTIGKVFKGNFVISDRLPAGGWMAIKYGDKDGFVETAGIDFYTPFIYKVAKDQKGIIIKEKPDSNSETLIIVKKGLVIEDYGEIKNGYSYIRYDNYIGFTKTNTLIKPKTALKYVDNSKDIVYYYDTIDSKDAWGLISTNQKVLVYSTVNGKAFIDEYPDDDEIEGYYIDSKYLVDKKPSTKNTEVVKKSSNTTTKSTSNTTNKRSNSHYKNCTELKKDFPNGVRRGHWAYAEKHDRDKDGWACES